MLHILRTSGYYLGQTRQVGCRNWDKATGHCSTAEKALARAVRMMERNDAKRARVIFIPTGENGQWYDPHIVMEANRV